MKLRGTSPPRASAWVERELRRRERRHAKLANFSFIFAHGHKGVFEARVEHRMPFMPSTRDL